MNITSPAFPPIVYSKQEINGIVVRPDSRSVMVKALQGHPIEVRSGNDYINLYHVFARMQRRSSALRKLRVVRQQIGVSCWRITIVNEDAAPPDVELQFGYDPKRGRYKRYAERLAAGEMQTFKSKAEAVKARRAWQLYVPAEKRTNLRAKVVKRKHAFVAFVITRPQAKVTSAI